jgi:hypothetical protein
MFISRIEIKNKLKMHLDFFQQLEKHFTINRSNYLKTKQRIS